MLSRKWIFLEIGKLHFKCIFLNFFGIEAVSHVIQTYLENDITHFFFFIWNVVSRIFYRETFMFDDFGFGLELVPSMTPSMTANVEEDEEKTRDQVATGKEFAAGSSARCGV